MKFAQNMNVAKITGVDWVLEVHEKPCVCLGHVYWMTIVMQGESPWVRVEYGEWGKNIPDEYFNAALLKSIVLSKFLYGTPAKPTSEEEK